MAQVKDEVEKLMDDANIIGGSPKDRVIGMLLERTEAMRELHESMRSEMRDLLNTHGDLKNMMGRIVERLETHEKSDTVSFGSLQTGNASISLKLDALTAQIASATTANLVQKAQLSAGWKVICYIGGFVLFLWAVFTTFFNHRSG